MVCPLQPNQRKPCNGLWMKFEKKNDMSSYLCIQNPLLMPYHCDLNIVYR